jgi:hypothetical protein
MTLSAFIFISIEWGKYIIKGKIGSNTKGKICEPWGSIP